MHLFFFFFLVILVFSQESQWLHLEIEQFKEKAEIKSVYSGSSVDYLRKKNTKKINGRIVYELLNPDGISVYRSEIACYCHIRVENIEHSGAQRVQIAETNKITYGISIPDKPDMDKILLYHYLGDKITLLLESKIQKSRKKLKIDRFDVVKMFDKGNPANLINFVFLAEGYQKNEMDKFASDVQKALDRLFTMSPFDKYKNYFNVYRINVESKESGSTHPGTARDEPSSAPVYSHDTYFKSSYDGGGSSVHRLLVIQDYFKADAVLNSHIPYWDQAFFLVNDPMYGGSGGLYGVSSVNSSMPDILVHELGHSFAGLADEYNYGGGSGFESPNTTLVTNRNNIKWSPWINNSTPIPTPATDTYKNLVGLFEGAAYTATGCYRPQLHCMMKSLNYDFCYVCREHLVSTIYREIKPDFRIFPTNVNIISDGNSLDFSVEEKSGIKLISSFSPRWYVNDKLVHTGYTLKLQPYDFLPHDRIRLKCLLFDETDFVRIPAKKKSMELISKEWLIQKKKTNHLIASYPEKKNIGLKIGEELLFKVTIINKTLDASQQWFINNELLASADSLSFNTANREIGEYEVLYRLLKGNGQKEKELTWKIDLRKPSFVRLKQNYPNPFNASTTIRFQLNEKSKVTLTILNALGQTIKTLINREFNPGLREINWNGKNDKNEIVSSGIYFYNLKTGKKSITKKMVLLK